MANGKVSQIGGFLKMLLMGRSAGNELPMAVDADGHLQVDITFSTGTATPSSIHTNDTASVGSSSLSSKEDHVHGFPCAGVSGTFVSADVPPKTITVTLGIITGIV